ncbi:hypothetical protein [Blastococcus carthaginiensis]|uniref:hypothetical protein n=1 Tax=Blastococcus carthaginiensis TaxID=3050034 RepID=UPI0038733D35
MLRHRFGSHGYERVDREGRVSHPLVRRPQRGRTALILARAEGTAADPREPLLRLGIPERGLRVRRDRAGSCAPS